MDSPVKLPASGGQRGAVIIVVIFLVVLIAVFMIGISLVHRSDLETVSNQIEDMQAYYCAEHGIERAYLKIIDKAKWPTTGEPENTTVWTDKPCYDSTDNVPPITDTGDTYTVQVSETRGDPNDTTGNYNFIWVTSSSTIHNSRFKRSIRALFRRTKVVQNQGGAPMCPSCFYVQILLYQEL